MTPVFAGVAGTPAVWPVLVRPSGNVIPGIPPQFVVVLLDGIGSQQAGFRMNPYQPTSVGPASYCPEGLNSSGRPLQRANPDGTLDGNAFAVAPHGPYEFFEKWNYYDAYDARNHNIPSKGSNSTPRDLATGRPTHSFLLDQLAATGAIILPYSYWGAKLESSTRFVYNAYSNCNSNPAPSVIVCNTDTEAVRMPGTGGADPGGSPDPSHRDVSNARHSFSVGDDIQRLEDEIASIHKVWRHVPIIVIGHSQGGLIAFDWWKRFWLSWGDSNSAGYGHTGVWKLFSLDSPINGACLGPTCLNAPGYPNYTNRVNDCIPQGHGCMPNPDYDNRLLDEDRGAGDPFRFIGTVGDSIVVPQVFGWSAYGPPGRENLQHELLFHYTFSCTGLPPFPQGESCQAPQPPDHVSECPITSKSPQWVVKDAHFIEKFCPGNVSYLNTVLGINNLSPGGCNPAADAARPPSDRTLPRRSAPRRTC